MRQELESIDAAKRQAFIALAKFLTAKLPDGSDAKTWQQRLSVAFCNLGDEERDAETEYALLCGLFDIQTDVRAGR